jgi:hypothetical protein
MDSEQKSFVKTWPEGSTIYIKRIPQADIPRVDLRIYPDTAITGNLVLIAGDGETELGRTEAGTCTQQNPWLFTVLSNDRYVLKSDRSINDMTIEPLELAGPGPHDIVYKP